VINVKIFKFHMPPINLIGVGCLKDVGREIKKLGFKKGIIVTDKVLVRAGLVNNVISVLEEEGIEYVVFDETKPNPTIKNVTNGLKLLIENKCDFIISCGGGSAHDCAKGIGLIAKEKNFIDEVERLDKVKCGGWNSALLLPLVAINTTAGTGSEVTKFAIITDEEKRIKMPIVDWRITPLIAVNDPLLMIGMPKSLTAASGMDALTHAIEAYISINANPFTDALALKAIEIIFNYLKRAVENGNDIEAREKMAYAAFLAGIAFNNAGLGYVHAMAHQLGGFYDLPHGVCNAILLPHVLAYNFDAVPNKLIDIAKAMGVDVGKINTREIGDKVIESINQLSQEIGIPSRLKELGVKEEDIKELSQNALKDVCGFTNPKKATLEDIINIFKSAM